MTRPGRLSLAVAAVVLAAPIVGAQVFRAGVDTVLLPVTVTDSRNRPLTDLDRNDFRVFEDGVVQDVSVFARDPQPIALSVLIDSSTSMEDKMEMAQQAAIGFAYRLGKNDVAQIIDFNSDIQIRQPFTNDVGALERAIKQVRASGSTSFYTAIYIAVSELGRVRATTPDEIRRQAIVVLSDGEDNSSLKSYDDVAETVKRSNVAIYAIGLRDKESSPNRRFSQADFALRTLSQVTGGRVYFVDEIKQLPAIYLEIADELASQYFIGYNTKNLKRDGAWRQIAVRVARPETIVRTRAGYFGPTKSSP